MSEPIIYSIGLPECLMLGTKKLEGSAETMLMFLGGRDGATLLKADGPATEAEQELSSKLCSESTYIWSSL